MSIIDELKVNPKNPRSIKDFQFEKLKKSLKEFPKMLELRPIIYDDNYIILGGNMRLRALQELKNEGFEIDDKWFVKVSDLTEEQKREFIIKDNVPFGDWDDDILANEWSDLPLTEWGINTGKWQPDLDTSKMWDGMPEFNGINEGVAFRSIIIHFDNQENVNNFAELLGQTITEKTKYLWFPFKEKQDLKSLEVKTDEP